MDTDDALLHHKYVTVVAAVERQGLEHLAVLRAVQYPPWIHLRQTGYIAGHLAGISEEINDGAAVTFEIKHNGIRRECSKRCVVLVDET